MDIKLLDMPTVKLLVKDQYGRTVFHPDNVAAHHLAAIAGTKTLTPDAIKHIKALGFDVVYTSCAQLR
jgi:hypothetical protein